MSSLYPILQFPDFRRMSLRTPSPFLDRFKGLSPSPQSHHQHLSSIMGVEKTRCVVSCAANANAGQFDGARKLNLDKLMDAMEQRWESLPQPIKNFPWAKAIGNFFETLFDLVYAVAKYLCIPLLAISSLSEMSYCAHERKMGLVPIPLLAGIAIAAVLNGTAIEISPRLKEGEYPWHLLAIAIFFTLLKLPGPYYPYWGRIFIPHFANGVLWGTIGFAILWYRRPHKAPKTIIVDEIQSEEKKS
ncbi:uncharacterized protein LOC143875843 [Tasmannia lanceolata]|uniref:uncharacterized protein LOC143875843 n=1 Tax=Tasmannia lanceolata TaxID=3420 RepID=UPI004062EA3F